MGSRNSAGGGGGLGGAGGGGTGWSRGAGLLGAGGGLRTTGFFGFLCLCFGLQAFSRLRLLADPCARRLAGRQRGFGFGCVLRLRATRC